MSELSQYLTVAEGMTSISAVINAVKSTKNHRTIHSVLVSSDVIRKKHREIAFLKANAELLGYTISYVERNEIDRICGGMTHGGFAAYCTARPVRPLEASDIPKTGFIAALEGIEDPYNLGYTVRSLYAAGANAVLLPERNWMQTDAESTVIKSSAGTIELMDIYFENLYDAALMLKKQGYRIACAGIRDSVSIYDADLTLPLLLIIGGEKRGISSTLMSLGDFTVRIDYARQFMGSLTTASAAAVIAFEVMRQNNLKKVNN